MASHLPLQHPGAASTAAGATSSSTAAGAFSAPLDELRRTATGMEAAARAARELSEHPGQVRGRAQDGGDEELRDAAALMADRWQWSLDRLAGDVSRWTALLHVVIDQYAEIEREQVSAVRHLGQAAGAVTHLATRR